MTAPVEVIAWAVEVQRPPLIEAWTFLVEFKVVVYVHGQPGRHQIEEFTTLRGVDSLGVLVIMRVDRQELEASAHRSIALLFRNQAELELAIELS
jgi:hypothetical protein